MYPRSRITVYQNLTFLQNFTRGLSHQKYSQKFSPSILHLLLNNVYILPSRVSRAIHRLVLLILGYKIEQISVCIGELVLLHSFTGEPVQKRFPFEHQSELS